MSQQLTWSEIAEEGSIKIHNDRLIYSGRLSSFVRRWSQGRK